MMGLAISYGYIFLIMGIALVTKITFKVSTDISRKIIHIGVGNWVIFAYSLFDSALFLAIVPASFIVLNYLSYKFKIIKAMEQEDESLGTVWYAVSLLVLILVGFYTGQKELAIAGILCMTYGDGFAAIIGKKFGKNLPFGDFENKSIPGFLTMFIMSFFVVYFTLLIFNGKSLILIALITALASALLEAASKNGYDNLSVPFGVSFVLWVLLSKGIVFNDILMMIATTAILIFAFAKKSITLPASIHAFFIAAALYYFVGWILYTALILFFILGSILSKVGKKKHEIEKKVHKRQGARGVVQVYANAGVPLILSFLFSVTGNYIFFIGAMVAFSTAMADTASSEIGVLSKNKPINIIGFKKTETGLSGGITFLGTISGVIFSFLISLLLMPYGISLVLFSTFAGFLGSLIDSVLGATIQAKYENPVDNYLTEKNTLNGKPLVLYSGLKAIDNDFVNFLTLLITSFLILLVLFFVPFSFNILK